MKRALGLLFGAVLLAGCGTSAPAAAPQSPVPTSVVTSIVTVTPSPSIPVPSTTASRVMPVKSSAQPTVDSADHAALVALCKKYCGPFKVQRNKPTCISRSVTGDDECVQRIGDTGAIVVHLNLDLPGSKVDIGLHPALRKRIDTAIEAWDASEYVTKCSFGPPDQPRCNGVAHTVLGAMDAVGVELQAEAA